MKLIDQKEPVQDVLWGYCFEASLSPEVGEDDCSWFSLKINFPFSCNNNNFARRSECNRCGESRPGGGGGGGGGGGMFS